MALSISFFAIAVSFIVISMTYFNKAKQMPDATNAEAAEKKKMKNNGVAFFTIGISFICTSIVFAMR